MEKKKKVEQKNLRHQNNACNKEIEKVNFSTRAQLNKDFCQFLVC